MWIYILRRLMAMVPTLFGVTIVSFTVMQLAPGDPLLNQLGSVGAAGSSSQTREQYLVQKRDLKLDKPLLLNVRYFQDYETPLRSAAFFRSLTKEEIASVFPLLLAPPDVPARLHRAFLDSLKIDRFTERLKSTEEHARLAVAVEGFVQIYFENVGVNGVSTALALLRSDVDDRTRIGLIRGLNSMIVDPIIYTYSREPQSDETETVMTTWRTWWTRAERTWAPVDEERRTSVHARLRELALLPSYKEMVKGLEGFRKDDARYFAELLLADSDLKMKVVASVALRQYIGRPLTMDVPINAKEQELREVTENWVAYFECNRDRYEPSLPVKILRIFTDTQYAHMVARLVTFQFGRSALKTRDPVGKKIWDAVIVTAPLMLLAELFIYLVAIPLGILCAVKKGRWQDRLITLALYLLYSIPSYVAGMLFLVFLCYGNFLKLFPMLGLHATDADKLSGMAYAMDYVWHIALPVICLALFSLASLAIYSRSSMLDVITQDYIRTARAKGVSEGKVIWKHALRNALIPLITLFSHFLPAMLGGSVLVEHLFSINGMGRLSFSSIENKDFPTLMALFYIDAIVVMLSILISDILYVIVDPRISFEGRAKAA